MSRATTKKSCRAIPIAALAVGLVAAAALFLFRRSTHDNPALGVVTIEYRWGSPSRILLDVNRDGTPDAKELLRPGSDGLSPHSLPAEMWESTRCDGFTDLHAVFDTEGRASLVEYDADRDGQYEQRFDAEAATSFLRDLERPAGCGAKIEY